MKVLVVEDSNIMRRTIVKVVKDSGHTTIEAENGAEALAKLRKHEHDLSLIIMDWNMPVMDGYEALVKIRAREEFDRIRIIMATSAGVQEDVLKAIKAGADSYLVKPFSKQALADRIEEVYSGNKAQAK